MMCSAEVTGSLVPTVAKQIQSVEPETNKRTVCQHFHVELPSLTGLTTSNILLVFLFFFNKCCWFEYKVLKTTLLHKHTPAQITAAIN